MRVAIVDDEPLARSGLRARLDAQRDLDIVAEYADGVSAMRGLRAQAVDLAFVDVRMPGASGLEVLASLPEAQRPLAILLTAYDGFAVRAFELRAIDYLLKPIDDARLSEALERAREMHRWRASAVVPPLRHDAGTAYPRRFEVRVGRRLRFVEVDAIVWIEADGDYARLHADGQDHLIRESLNRLMSRLDPGRFVRVHRSAIVRLDWIDELQPLANRDAILRLRDGTPVRASRTHIEPLISRLAGIATPIEAVRGVDDATKR
ncbi:MAG: LytR/AlgR family response regulator transcription factor [Pseudomonadota bacterium]